MSSLAHTPGGLRPAYAAEPAFHPGLQVHAIAEPRPDRRLSLLISILCYESMAAVVLLTMHHREAILTHIQTHTDVILDPVKAALEPPALKPVLPAPPAGPALPMAVSQPPAVPMPEAAPDAPPANLPSLNQGSTTLGTPNPTGVLGVGQTDGANTGVGVGRYSTGQVIDVEMAQVQVLHRVDPVYPALARLVGAQGDVVLRMTIDAKGLPSEVKVVSGPEALRAEALRCARQWRFTPALMGGEAVPAAFNLTLRFMLRR